MNAYKNNGASHTMKDGTEVKRDGIIETDEDLVKAFPNKFTLVSGIREQKSPLPPPKKKAPSKGSPDDSGKKNSEEMVEVTDKFTVPEGFKVMRDRRGCWVFDGDKDPANEKPLKRDEVEAFIKECAA